MKKLFKKLNTGTQPKVTKEPLKSELVSLPSTTNQVKDQKVSSSQELSPSQKKEAQRILSSLADLKKFDSMSMPENILSEEQINQAVDKEIRELVRKANEEEEKRLNDEKMKSKSVQSSTLTREEMWKKLEKRLVEGEKILESAMDSFKQNTTQKEDVKPSAFINQTGNQTRKIMPVSGKVTSLDSSYKKAQVLLNKSLDESIKILDDLENELWGKEISTNPKAVQKPLTEALGQAVPKSLASKGSNSKTFTTNSYARAQVSQRTGGKLKSSGEALSNQAQDKHKAKFLKSLRDLQGALSKEEARLSTRILISQAYNNVAKENDPGFKAYSSSYLKEWEGFLKVPARNSNNNAVPDFKVWLQATIEELQKPVQNVIYTN